MKILLISINGILMREPPLYKKQGKLKLSNARA